MMALNDVNKGELRVKGTSSVTQSRKHRGRAASGLARNHHYVPQWLLRQWKSESGRLWVAKRVRGKWKIRKSSIKRSFSHVGLYDVFPHVPHANPSDSVERRLSRIESDVARSWIDLRRRLDQGVRWVNVGTPSAQLLKLHIWLQYSRTPQFFEFVRGQTRYGQPEIDRAVARVEAAGGRVTDEERRAVADGSMLDKCRQTAQALNVIMQDGSSPSWRILMEERCLVVGRAVDNVRFVISDHPVLRCNSVPGSGSTLANPHLQLWTPLSPRYALGLVDPSAFTPGTVAYLDSPDCCKNCDLLL